MLTWWKASSWSFGPKVQPVEVEKFTDKCIWMSGRRQNRISAEYHCYFPTETEAWDHIERKKSAEVEHAKVTLQRYRSELGQIQSERRAAGC